MKKMIIPSILFLIMNFVFVLGANGTMMPFGMIPLHILQIIVAVFVGAMVWIVIERTGQMKIFVYIPIAMLLFLVSAIFAFAPHFGWVSDDISHYSVVIFETIGLILLGVSFYLWKRMLK